IMHVTVIKQEIVDKYPWAAVSLVKAFEKAKQVCYQRVVNPRIVPLAWFSYQWNEERKLLGPDPWGFVLGEANKKNLVTIIRYCHQQGLIAREMSIEELFVDTDPGDAGGDEGHYLSSVVVYLGVRIHLFALVDSIDLVVLMPLVLNRKIRL